MWDGMGIPILLEPLLKIDRGILGGFNNTNHPIREEDHVWTKIRGGRHEGNVR